MYLINSKYKIAILYKFLLSILIRVFKNNKKMNFNHFFQNTQNKCESYDHDYVFN